MRWAAYAVLGVAGWLGLHVAIVWPYYPPDDRVVEPLQLARAPSVPGEATLLFAGDTAQIDASLPTLAARGFDFPFRPTVDLVRGADVAIVNHEAPITDGGREIPVWEGYTYRAPSAAAAALAWAGFDLLTIANNHALDYGMEGLEDTVRHAAQHGMTVIGAGASGAEARRGAIVTVGDLRVGVLPYLENQLAFRTYLNFFAVRNKPGIAPLTEGTLARDLGRLRPAVDVLVVSLHAGDNYAPPRSSTVRWARRAVELGADLVVCHHPHVAHPVMLHRGKPILLSLGNYAFGTPGFPQLEHGWLALAHVTGRRLDRVEIVPLDVQNRRVAFQPQPLAGEERERALSRLAAESRPFGAELRVAEGRAILEL